MAGSQVKVEDGSARSKVLRPGEDASFTVVHPDGQELHRTIQQLVDARLKAIEGALEGLTGLADRFSVDPERAAPEPREVAVPVDTRQAPAPVRAEPALLERVDATPRVERILVAWVGALLDDVGADALPEALAHLEAIGWIARDVRIRMARMGVSIRENARAAPTDRRISRAALERSLAAIEEIQGCR